MIYTKADCAVEIIGRCGEYKPKYLKFYCRLVKIQYIHYPAHDPNVSFYFIDFLRATNGYSEIMRAYDKSEVIKLTKKELEKAFREAE